jgi:hypothetical protein
VVVGPPKCLVPRCADASSHTCRECSAGARRGEYYSANARLSPFVRSSWNDAFRVPDSLLEGQRDLFARIKSDTDIRIGTHIRLKLDTSSFLNNGGS